MSTPARTPGPGPAASTGVPIVVLAALACAFLLLALLVETGVCAVIDRFSIAHLMPGLRPGAPTGNWLDGLYLPFPAGSRPLWAALADLWLYPCSVVVSALLLAAGALGLRRRGRDRLAAAFVLAWAVGDGIELVGKGTIRRPALYAPNAEGVLVHLRAYDASFPSGHTIRGALVAALLVALWPRARRLAGAWYATVPPLLVLTAAHTVVDVLGGLLVGAALVGAVSRVRPARSLRPDPRAGRARSAPAVESAGA